MERDAPDEWDEYLIWESEHLISLPAVTVKTHTTDLEFSFTYICVRKPQVKVTHTRTRTHTHTQLRVQHREPQGGFFPVAQ